MTQILSFGPTPRLGGAASRGIAAVATVWLFSKVKQPDTIVVVGVCAIGLLVSLVAASTIPDFSSALADVYAAVGP